MSVFPPGIRYFQTDSTGKIVHQRAATDARPSVFFASIPPAIGSPSASITQVAGICEQFLNSVTDIFDSKAIGEFQAILRNVHVFEIPKPARYCAEAAEKARNLSTLPGFPKEIMQRNGLIALHYEGKVKYLFQYNNTVCLINGGRNNETMHGASGLDVLCTLDGTMDSLRIRDIFSQPKFVSSNDDLPKFTQPLIASINPNFDIIQCVMRGIFYAYTGKRMGDLPNSPAVRREAHAIWRKFSCYAEGSMLLGRMEAIRTKPTPLEEDLQALRQAAGQLGRNMDHWRRKIEETGDPLPQDLERFCSHTLELQEECDQLCDSIMARWPETRLQEPLLPQHFETVISHQCVVSCGNRLSRLATSLSRSESQPATVALVRPGLRMPLANEKFATIEEATQQLEIALSYDSVDVLCAVAFHIPIIGFDIRSNSVGAQQKFLSTLARASKKLGDSKSFAYQDCDIHQRTGAPVLTNRLLASELMRAASFETAKRIPKMLKVLGNLELQLSTFTSFFQRSPLCIFNNQQESMLAEEIYQYSLSKIGNQLFGAHIEWNLDGPLDPQHPLVQYAKRAFREFPALKATLNSINPQEIQPLITTIGRDNWQVLILLSNKFLPFYVHINTPAFIERWHEKDKSESADDLYNFFTCMDSQMATKALIGNESFLRTRLSYSAWMANGNFVSYTPNEQRTNTDTSSVQDFAVRRSLSANASPLFRDVVMAAVKPSTQTQTLLTAFENNFEIYLEKFYAEDHIRQYYFEDRDIYNLWIEMLLRPRPNTASPQKDTLAGPHAICVVEKLAKIHKKVCRRFCDALPGHADVKAICGLMHIEYSILRNLAEANPSLYAKLLASDDPNIKAILPKGRLDRIGRLHRRGDIGPEVVPLIDLMRAQCLHEQIAAREFNRSIAPLPIESLAEMAACIYRARQLHQTRLPLNAAAILSQAAFSMHVQLETMSHRDQIIAAQLFLRGVFPSEYNLREPITVQGVGAVSFGKSPTICVHLLSADVFINGEKQVVFDQRLFQIKSFRHMFPNGFYPACVKSGDAYTFFHNGIEYQAFMRDRYYPEVLRRNFDGQFYTLVLYDARDEESLKRWELLPPVFRSERLDCWVDARGNLKVLPAGKEEPVIYESDKLKGPGFIHRADKPGLTFCPGSSDFANTVFGKFEDYESFLPFYDANRNLVAVEMPRYGLRFEKNEQGYWVPNPNEDPPLRLVSAPALTAEDRLEALAKLPNASSPLIYAQRYDANSGRPLPQWVAFVPTSDFSSYPALASKLYIAEDSTGFRKTRISVPSVIGKISLAAEFCKERRYEDAFQMLCGIEKKGAFSEDEECLLKSMIERITESFDDERGAAILVKAYSLWKLHVCNFIPHQKCRAKLCSLSRSNCTISRVILTYISSKERQSSMRLTLTEECNLLRFMIELEQCNPKECTLFQEQIALLESAMKGEALAPRPEEHIYYQVRNDPTLPHHAAAIGDEEIPLAFPSATDVLHLDAKFTQVAAVDVDPQHLPIELGGDIDALGRCGREYTEWLRGEIQLGAGLNAADEYLVLPSRQEFIDIYQAVRRLQEEFHREKVTLQAALLRQARALQLANTSGSSSYPSITEADLLRAFGLFTVNIPGKTNNAKRAKQFLISRGATMNDDDLRCLMELFYKFALVASNDRHFATLRSDMEEVLRGDDGPIDRSDWVKLRPAILTATQPNDAKPIIALFELFSGIRTRPDQREFLEVIIDALIRKDSILIQQLMGSGKTLVNIPFLVFFVDLLPDAFPLLCVHSSQMASIHKEFLGTMQVLTGVKISYLSLPSEHFTNLERLREIHQTLESTLRHGGQLPIIESRTLMGLRAQYKSLSSPERTPKEQAVRRMLGAILLITKDRGFAILDEVHMTLNPKETFIMQAAAAQDAQLKIDDIDLTYSIIESLPQNLLDAIAHNTQEAFNANELQSMFRQCLENHLNKFLIPEPPIDRQVLINFILNPRLPFPEGIRRNSSIYEKICVLRGIFTTYLPNCLSRNYNQHYGFDEEGNCVPFWGVATPSPNRFQNPYEIAIYTTLSVTMGGLPRPAAVAAVSSMLQSAIDAVDPSMTFPETPAAIRFATLFRGARLPDGRELTLALFDGGRVELPRDLDIILAIEEKIKSTPLLQRQLVQNFIRDQTTHRTESYGCSSCAIADLFAASVAMTGTPANRSIYGGGLNEHCKLQNGSLGRVIHKCLKDFGSGRATITEIPKAKERTARTLLETFMQQQPEHAQKVHAFVDVAGFLKDVPNRQSAMEIAAVIRENPRGEWAFLTHIEYYDNELQAFAILEICHPDRPPQLIGSGAAAIPASQRFVFLDQSHATGSNPKLPRDSCFLVTANGANTTLEDLLQGVMRARGFMDGNGQTVSFLTSEEHHSHFTASSEMTTVGDILSTTARNSAQGLAQQNMQGGFLQIKEARDTILIAELIRSEDVSVPDEIKDRFYSEVQKIFLDEDNFDATRRFASGRELQNGQELLEAYLHQAKEQLREALSACQWMLPEEIDQRIAAMDEKLRPFTANVAGTMTLGRQDTDREIQLSVEARVEVHAQMEVNTELQQELQRELTIFNDEIAYEGARGERPFGLERGMSALQFFEPGLSPISKARSLYHELARQHDDFSRKVQKAYEQYDELFNDGFVLVENYFLETRYNGTCIFSEKYQEPVRAMVVIVDAQYPRVVFISQYALQEILANGGFPDGFVCDLNGQNMDVNHPLPDSPEAKHLLQRAMYEAHVFNGDVTWLNAHPEITAAGTRYHLKRFRQQPGGEERFRKLQQKFLWLRMPKFLRARETTAYHAAHTLRTGEILGRREERAFASLGLTAAQSFTTMAETLLQWPNLWDENCQIVARKLPREFLWHYKKGALKERYERDLDERVPELEVVPEDPPPDDEPAGPPEVMQTAKTKFWTAGTILGIIGITLVIIATTVLSGGTTTIFWSVIGLGATLSVGGISCLVIGFRS
ncbi:MAG: DUF3638 domain-containing protein [Puniceicoccales bacterium]|jgi:hypothetical protein|nr:DUF3638 domain-containing protein [Puniceicoccales bacterium]